MHKLVKSPCKECVLSVSLGGKYLPWIHSGLTLLFTIQTSTIHKTNLLKPFHMVTIFLLPLKTFLDLFLKGGEHMIWYVADPQ